MSTDDEVDEELDDENENGVEADYSVRLPVTIELQFKVKKVKGPLNATRQAVELLHSWKLEEFFHADAACMLGLVNRETGRPVVGVDLDYSTDFYWIRESDIEVEVED